MRTTVTTQSELDAALAVPVPAGDWHRIVIVSPAGVWLSLSTTPDSASVWAYDSASVQAYGSASVQAYGSASVRAYGSASVEAARYVAVRIHSAHAAVSGGVLIDLTSLDLNDTDTWVDYTGTERDGDTLTLYKAVRDDYASAHQFRTVYAIGSTVTAPDWRDDNDCGGGLHLSPTPHQAHDYDHEATRFLRCEVAVADWRPIPGGTAKGKAREVRVVAEVDIHGQEITS